MLAECGSCRLPCAVSVCSRCHSVAYCSEQHQRAAWRAHKADCALRSRLARMTLSRSSLPGLPTVTLTKPPGVVIEAGQQCTNVACVSDIIPGGAMVRIELIDEGGKFVGTGQVYATVDISESCILKLGGSYGLFLLRSTGRCTTTLFLAAGGPFSATLVSELGEFTKYLMPEGEVRILWMAGPGYKKMGGSMIEQAAKAKVAAAKHAADAAAAAFNASPPSALADVNAS